MSHSSLLIWIEAAILAVLAFIISLIPLNIAWIEIELGMVPIIIFAYRRGLKAGLLSGFLWGMIKVLSGDIWVLTLSQVLIEYLFAFAVSGLAGLGQSTVQDSLKNSQAGRLNASIIQSTTLACLVKYTIHFIAGLIFWSSYAPEGMGAFSYSLIVNGASFLLTSLAVSTVLVLLIPLIKPLILPR